MSATRNRPLAASARRLSAESAKGAKVSTLKERLERDLRAAMKAQDATRRETLRLILAGIKKAEDQKVTSVLVRTEVEDEFGEISESVSLPMNVDLSLTEAEIEDVVKRQAKMRRDAIETMASRPEIVARERAELAVIESYLPPRLDRAAITARARAAIAATGANSLREQGKVMQKLIPELRDQADGKVVAEVVRELLAKGS